MEGTMEKRYTVEDYYRYTPEGSPVELMAGVFYNRLTGEPIPEEEIQNWIRLKEKLEEEGEPDASIPWDSPEVMRGNGPSRKHQGISAALNFIIYGYILDNGGGCRIYTAPFDVELSSKDDFVVQPDISVICDPDKLTEHGCTGAPDWVIEITSPSRPSYDYIKKLELYYSAGAREYWIIDPIKEQILVYRFTEKELVPETYSFQDKIPVGIYPGLEIDFAQIIQRL